MCWTTILLFVCERLRRCADEPLAALRSGTTNQSHFKIQKVHQMHWKPYKPTEAMPWNLKRVVHLHRRAGFAAPWTQLQRDLADGPELALNRLLGGNEPPEQFEDLAEKIGNAAAGSNNPQRLKAWWLWRMLKTNDPLSERLTLMWHNHFATSNRKVKSLALMHGQNEIFRRLGRGGFGELLSSVVKHPAMLIWLDADSNRKGKPNENLSRELMELFTLAPGNYSEADVREAARALAGWTVINDKFEDRKARHDNAELTILGKSQPFTADQLLELLTQHPATANRIAWRICKTLISRDAVSESALKELAQGLTASGLDINWAVTTVLKSELFFSDANIRTKVIGPTEWIVGAIRCLGLGQTPPKTMALAQWAVRMGQNLFYPPNVGGWSEGRSWLSSRTIVARANFANALASGTLWNPRQAPNLDQLATDGGAAGDLESKVNWLCELLHGEALPKTVDAVVAASKKSDLGFASAAAMLLSRPEYQLG